MSAVAHRVAEWVEIAEDVLTASVGTYPVERIGTHLLRSLGATSVAFNWWSVADVGLAVVSEDGEHVGRRRIPDVLQVGEAFLREGLIDHHPLLRWFVLTGQPAAQTLGRVPVSMSAPRSAELLEWLRQFEIPRQLSIPVVLDERGHEAFVLARPGPDDFSEEDLLVARRAQGLLIALRVQAETVAAHLALPVVPPPDLLTPRECAVLSLLVDGFTDVAIAHRLSMAPRTASKHVEHIYRKLGVRDRVSAARVAAQLGFIPAGAGTTPTTGSLAVLPPAAVRVPAATRATERAAVVPSPTPSSGGATPRGARASVGPGAPQVPRPR